MKKVIILLLIIPQLLIAQNEGNIWYFGFGAGLDFNSGTAVAINDGQLNTLEGCASISDNNGDLLFYTDGMTVYDKNHNIMANGTGLLGHNSSTQSAIIVKKPQSLTSYYIFTVDGMTGNNGAFCYSEVDLSLNGGLGAITSLKNIELFTNAIEKVTAILHNNGSDFWIIAPRGTTSTYFTYLFSSTGISMTPTQSYSSMVYNDLGYLLASPDGSKICSAFYINDHVDLFNFDNNTGVISPYLQITNLNGPYGLAFSPDNNVLYVSTDIQLFQYDLLGSSNNEILSSVQVIQSDNFMSGALQLAPDGAIYHVSHTNTSYLSRISSPNSLGAACNYIEDAIYLTGSLTCGYGLPAFFSSIFASQFSISSSNYCFGDSTEFSVNTTPDSLFWDFGDINSGSENSSELFAPSHQFSSPGTYTITATTYENNFINQIETEITITAPLVNLGNDTTLCNGASLVLDITNSNATFFWQDLSTAPTYTISNEGLYWVEMTEFDCIATDSIYVNTYDVDVELIDDTLLCYGEKLLLQPTATDDVSFLWQNGSFEDTMLVVEEGIYWVRVSQNICEAFDTVYVAYNPPINAVISGEDSICEGETFEDALIMASGIGPFNITYSNGIGNYTLNGESPFDITIDQEGTYTISNIYGANNCEGTIGGQAIYVSVINPISDFYTANNEVFIDESEIVFENYSTFHSQSNWIFGDGYTIQDNAPFINHTFSEAETFYIELIVTNDFGCVDSSRQTLIVKPIEYFLPNAFTPNDNNNINDQFGLISDKVTSYTMIIFDRWGAMVFESNDIEKQWDGIVNGVSAQSGIYNYKVVIEDPLGDTHQLIGNVTLIK